jgi:hypothetical protein
MNTPPKGIPADQGREEVKPINETPEWQHLAEHYAALAGVDLRTLFAQDPKRGETMTVEAGDLFLDYSKNHLTSEAIGLLAALAERAGLPGRIGAMWRGERINTTEARPVLHVALRMPPAPASWSTAATSSRPSTTSSTRWRSSPSRSVSGSGSATPAGRSAT